jgi:predicted aspartyl protease
MAEAFTYDFVGLKREIKTPCAICEAFIPPKNGDKGQLNAIKITALWDTGASGSVITKNVADKLGLKPNGKALVHHANGESAVNTYLIGIMLPNNVVFSALIVTEGILNGMDVLIGMDIISKGDFCISNFKGNTKFTFQVPSTHDIDFVEEIDKKKKHIPLKAEIKTSRNAPCPCGSGKKYKNCCGKD